MSSAAGQGSQPLVQSLTALASEILDLPPSCLEFSIKHPQYFIIGTYHLEKEDDSTTDDGTTATDNALAAKLSHVSIQDSNDATSHVNKMRDASEQTDADLGQNAITENDDSNLPPLDKGKITAVEPDVQTRRGSLILYRIDGDALTMVYAITYPAAILDVHFSPHEPDIFLVATSVGTVVLFRLQTEPRPIIIQVGSFQICDDPTILVMSVTWHRSFPGLIGATLSNGKVCICQLKPGNETMWILRDDLSNHDGENAYTVAFSQTHDKKYPYRSQAMYSGGDDSRLRCITVKSLDQLRGNDAKDLSNASTGGLTGMGGHEAGVTAILCLPFDTEAGKDILVTGSYDDKIRVYTTYDYRPDALNTRPKTLAELDLGGGVWRLKFMKDYPTIYETSVASADSQESQTFRILATCMFAGAKILELKGSKRADWTIRVLATFEEHKSMCYASDVQPGAGSDQGVLCVSSSFYDGLVCLWRFKELKEDDN